MTKMIKKKILCRIMPTLVMLMLVHINIPASQNSYKQPDSKVLTQYDPSTNQTAVVIQPSLFIDLSSVNDEALGITAGYIYPGKVLATAPQFIEFGVFSQAKRRWKFDVEDARHLSV